MPGHAYLERERECNDICCSHWNPHATIPKGQASVQVWNWITSSLLKNNLEKLPSISFNPFFWYPPKQTTRACRLSQHAEPHPEPGTNLKKHKTMRRTKAHLQESLFSSPAVWCCLLSVFALGLSRGNTLEISGGSVCFGDCFLPSELSCGPHVPVQLCRQRSGSLVRMLTLG